MPKKPLYKNDPILGELAVVPGTVRERSQMLVTGWSEQAPKKVESPKPVAPAEKK